jgi:hypothetical protein
LIWAQDDVLGSSPAPLDPVRAENRSPTFSPVAPAAPLDSKRSTPAPGVSTLPPGARATPRRPEVEEPAPTDVGIYQLDGPFPLVRWLCAAHVLVWKGKGWTVKPGAADGAGPPPWCSDCELERQAGT